jgi:hypothetical protein
VQHLKIRTLLKGITRHWGFYFVAAKDTHEVGISDMSTVLAQMRLYDEWTSDLRSVSEEKRARCELENTKISTRLLLKLFAARALAFDLSLKLCEGSRGGW